MNNKRPLQDNERLDGLEYKGLKLIQRPDEYCFTSDAVLLSSLTKATPKQTVVDFGCGNGVVSILISAKTNAKMVYGLEIQDSAYQLACDNVIYNNMQDKIKIIQGDIQNSEQYFGKENIDIVVCNPPYFTQDSGQKRSCEQIALSRHESTCNLESIIKQASNILKFGGKLFMIHKSQRMAEVITACSNNNLEPKKIWLIYPKQNKAVDTFIIEAKKGGKSGMVLENIVVYNNDNTMTDIAKKLYNKE